MYWFAKVTVSAQAHGSLSCFYPYGMVIILKGYDSNLVETENVDVVEKDWDDLAAVKAVVGKVV